jgi:predicted acetyltransferase
VFFRHNGTGVAALISIRDCKYSKKDRRWIEEVYGEYLDSLADLNTSMVRVIGAPGEQQDQIFANWFANDHSHPLLIVDGVEPVGFALVTRPFLPRGADAAPERAADFMMSEFFIRPRHQRRGAGRDAATLIFDRFSGQWEIVEYESNAGAVAFWRAVVRGYSRGRFTERARHGEIRHHFLSRTQVFPGPADRKT